MISMIVVMASRIVSPIIIQRFVILGGGCGGFVGFWDGVIFEKSCSS